MPSPPGLSGFLLFFLYRAFLPRARLPKVALASQPRLQSSPATSSIIPEMEEDSATEDVVEAREEQEEEEDEDETNWAGPQVAALPEMWALIAQHSGLVGAWRLTGVCKASRQGANEYLSTLPGLVVSGGLHASGLVGDVWKLRPSTLKWESMPSLLTPTLAHTCCVVRGSLVVLAHQGDTSSSVERLSLDEGKFSKLPSLSCGGGIRGTIAIAVEESVSEMGQVMLLGAVQGGNTHTTVHLVDIATGTCTPQPDLIHTRNSFAAARLPGGRIICAGGMMSNKTAKNSAEIWGPAPEQPVQPVQENDDRTQEDQQQSRSLQDAPPPPPAAWTWRDVPAMSVGRNGCCGCVLSDGRFAVFGGTSFDGYNTSSCEALDVNGDAESWEPLPSMHDSRTHFTCAAVAGCVVVAGGFNRKSAEVFDEKLGRWFRLPHDVPCTGWLGYMGSNMPLM